MEELRTAIEWAQNIAFLLVGLWALRRWKRRGTDQDRWLAVTFVTLATIVFFGLVNERLPDVASEVVGRVVVVLLVVFPYFLLRFVDSFEPVPQGFRRVSGIVLLLLAGVGAALPDLADEGGPVGVGIRVYAGLVVAAWVVVLGSVAVRFWRAGTGQPTIVRNRLRLLALATVSLSLAIVLVGAMTGDEGIAGLALQLFGLAAAGLFLVGLTPPALLRLRWRQPEEARLYDAATGLMAATHAGQVADLLVPHIGDVVAARAVALVHRGVVIGAVNASTEDLAGLRDGASGVTSLALTDGAIHVWTNAWTPFFDEEEQALLARLALLAELALDRTTLLAEQEQARLTLEATNDELESFVYSASHDLKSPLIALLGYVDVLSTEYGDVLDDDGRFYLERMTRNCRFMESLVGDLLELSRVGRVDAPTELVDLHDVVVEIADDLRQEHPGLTVHVGALPTIWLNGLRARQLFRNLLGNAAVHGGSAHLNVWVEAEPAAETGGAVVVVRDDGEGIPLQYHERVFGVFERLVDTGSGAGTGIGLAICRKIVESAGGTIALADTDVGAEFHLTLPAAVVATGPTTRADEVSV